MAPPRYKLISPIQRSYATVFELKYRCKPRPECPSQSEAYDWASNDGIRSLPRDQALFRTLLGDVVYKLYKAILIYDLFRFNICATPEVDMPNRLAVSANETP